MKFAIPSKRLIKPYYEHGGITIYHGDCREILPTLPKMDLGRLPSDYYELDNQTRAARSEHAKRPKRKVKK